jgi:2-phosphosulfolactate phosphatase
VKVEVSSLYTEVRSASLRGAVAVVIDVLRASTTIVKALARGARAVVPVAEIAEALDERRRLVERGWRVVLAGERGGVRPEGFDLGNSPAEFSRAGVAGSTVVLTTTNGTRALRHCREATRVLVGCFANGPALAGFLGRMREERAVLVCSGQDGRVAEEDVLFAGYLSRELERSGARPDASAEEAQKAYASAEQGLERALGATPHGRTLLELGFAADIAAAAVIGSEEIVAEMIGNGIIAAGRRESC